MKIYIRDRDWIEEMAEHRFLKNTALISVTDVGYEFAELGNKPEYLLQLKFDDVDADEPINIISDEQAREIAEFYHKVSKTAKRLICQCEHGQGRSAAIAAAIKEYTEKKGIMIFANDKYYPNKVVFRKVLKYLYKRGLSMRYTVKSYLCTNFSEQINSLETDDWEEVEDFIWENVQRGFNCELTDNETGNKNYAYADDFDEEALNPVDLLRVYKKRATV